MANYSYCKAILKISQADVPKGSEVHSASGPFSLHLTSPSLGCRWGVVSPQRQQREFVSGFCPIKEVILCMNNIEEHYCRTEILKEAGN
jgi:hypothetical protein